MESQIDYKNPVQDNKNRKKQFLQSIIDASARYERLSANSDFNAVLKDLENLIALHNNEISNYLSAYSDSSSIFKKMRIAEIMSQHQIRMQQIKEAVNYPQNIIQKAVEAREELAKIIAHEKEQTNV